MPMRRNRTALVATIFALLFGLLLPANAPALTFKSAPARYWGYLLKGSYSNATQIPTSEKPKSLEEKKSEWRINFTNFPADAKQAVQRAVDIWSSSFSSKVPVTVDAIWEKDQNSSVLGSARPGFYFNGFPGAPDEDIWYPSTLANTLAGKDLDPKQSEIVLKINSSILWYTGIDGKPSKQSYDLTSVALHEIGHGMGFLSNAEYDRFFGTGYMFQPTPYDAFVQLPDGRTFLDFCSRSLDLGKAMTSNLVWSGNQGIAANGGAKPKLFTPTPYLDGSSITHLDEDSFAQSSTDALMTPNLEPGESFDQVGPVALGMIQDMLTKPSTSTTSDKPAKPINVRALIGDQYALVTFDSPNCRRLDRVTGFNVTVNPGDITKTFTSSPAKITGLKNGTSYTFTVSAQNAKGYSDPVTSNSIKPESTSRGSVIDAKSSVNYFAATTWRNLPTVVYEDEVSGQLKMATYNASKWTTKSLRDGVKVGNISLCKSGSGLTEQLHIIYADLDKKDVVHGYQVGTAWKFEIVDGNGEQVQDYSEPTRTRTAADVSVSNACAVTPSGLQVFYRDETQGILLGAVKTSSGWVYEIVDGDRKTQGRTTGDVAFHLAATSLGKTVYLFYDSVITITASHTPTEGEVRLASRSSVFPEDWKYTIVDGPDAGVAVAGFAVALANSGKTVGLSWLSANGDSLPFADQVKFVTVDNLQFPGALSASNYGRPQNPLSIDGKGVIFGCQTRICKATTISTSVSLVNGATTTSSVSAIISVNKIRYSLASIDSKLTLVRI